MTVGIIEMDIHKCQFKGCMEFCKHFNRDKKFVVASIPFVRLHAYFTNTPELVFFSFFFLLFKNVKWIIHSNVFILKLFVMC